MADGASRGSGSGDEGDGSAFVLGLLERLADIGARPEDSHDDWLRMGGLILAAVGIALISFVWVLTYLVFDEPLAAAIPAAYQAITLVGLLVLSRMKRSETYAATEPGSQLHEPGSP